MSGWIAGSVGRMQDGSERGAGCGSGCAGLWWQQAVHMGARKQGCECPVAVCTLSAARSRAAQVRRAVTGGVSCGRSGPHGTPEISLSLCCQHRRSNGAACAELGADAPSGAPRAGPGALTPPPSCEPGQPSRRLILTARRRAGGHARCKGTICTSREGRCGPGALRRSCPSSCLLSAQAVA